MTISIIAAVSENYVIGRDNRLIWRLPADMQYFINITEGHCVLMGRKNFLSIPEQFRPLKNRINIVVTRQNDLLQKNPPEAKNLANPVFFVNSIDSGIELARARGEKELFIIGGGEIYNQTIDKKADKLYITWVHNTFDGSTFFPEINFKLWKETSRKDCKPDEKHNFAYSFCIYEKVSP